MPPNKQLDDNLSNRVPMMLRQGTAAQRTGEEERRDRERVIAIIDQALRIASQTRPSGRPTQSSTPGGSSLSTLNDQTDPSEENDGDAPSDFAGDDSFSSSLGDQSYPGDPE